MANSVTFLKNYVKFGYKVRTITASSFLKTLIENDDPDVKKAMMLRIVEEQVASSEDLAMWIAAVKNKDKADKKRRDVWEYLLLCQVNETLEKEALNSVSRARTIKGLLSKFGLPPLKDLAQGSKLNEEQLVPILNKLQETIKIIKHNRTVRKGLVLRAQNKIKHGMVVLSVSGGVMIRDYKPKDGATRIVRKNKNIFIDVDEERAKKMVGSIEATGYAIMNLVSFLILDSWYKLKTRKRKLSPKEREFWTEVLEYKHE